jgi:hypothetical protein
MASSRAVAIIRNLMADIITGPSQYTSQEGHPYLTQEGVSQLPFSTSRYDVGFHK